MEIVVHENHKKDGKPVGKEITLAIPKGKQSKAPSKPKKKNKGNKGNVNLSSYYADHLIYPDILGPCHQPRFGSAARTGLGIMRLRWTITGHATTLVQGIQMNPIYTNGANNLNTLTATNPATLFTVTAAGSPAVIFPSPSQIADVNIVAQSLVVTYLGNPLNVAGEILIGSCIPILSSSDYNSMIYYPATTRYPISELINKPLRAFGRKLSEQANEFIPTSVGFADYDSCYLITNNLPVGQVIVIDVCETFEYRSTTASSAVIPYDSSSASGGLFETNLFQQAQSLVSSVASPVIEALPSFAKSFTNSFMSYARQSAVGAMGNIAGLMTSRYLPQLQAGSYRQRPISLRYHDEL